MIIPATCRASWTIIPMPRCSCRKAWSLHGWDLSNVCGRDTEQAAGDEDRRAYDKSERNNGGNSCITSSPRSQPKAHLGSSGQRSAFGRFTISTWFTAFGGYPPLRVAPASVNRLSANKSTSWKRRWRRLVRTAWRRRHSDRKGRPFRIDRGTYRARISEAHYGRRKCRPATEPTPSRRYPSIGPTNTASRQPDHRSRIGHSNASSRSQTHHSGSAEQHITGLGDAWIGGRGDRRNGPATYAAFASGFLEGSRQ